MHILNTTGGVLAKIFLAVCINVSLNAKDEIVLDEIEITTHRLSAKKSRLNNDKITKNIIIDENDLMRKEVAASVAQGGRSGANGYSMRGVDSDRVSIKVDNMEAAQSFAPSFHQKQGFTSGVRGSTEIENLSTFGISKGANSLMAGNGALGGVVSMQTKTAQDFVEPGKMLGFYTKFGYSSKNDELRKVYGMGFIADGFEGLFQFTRRDGHETKTYYSSRIKDKTRKEVLGTSDFDKFFGSGRILPDPLTYNTNSILAKFGYRFDEHFVNLFYESKNIDNKIDEKSFPAKGNDTDTIDKTPYKRYGVQYEFFGDIVEELKFQLARQEIKQIYKQDSVMLGSGKDFTRNVQTTQNKTQFDFSINTTDLPIQSTYHSFYFNAGIGKENFENDIFWSELIGKSKKLQLNDKNGMTLIKDSNGIPIIIPAPKGKLGIRKESSGFGDKEFLTINGKDFREPFIILNRKVYIQNGKATYSRPIMTRNFYVSLQDYVQINDKISSNFGLRFDKIYHTLHKTEKLGAAKDKAGAEITKAIWAMPDSKKYSKFSYNAGAKYEIFDDTMLEYSFSTAFKTPTIEESFVEFRMKNHYLSNFNLKPEIAYNNEIELSSNFDFMAFSASLFYTKYKDFIDYRVSNIIEKKKRWDSSAGKMVEKDEIVGLKYQYQNIAKADLKGIELKTRIGADSGMFGTFMFSYQKGNKSDKSSLMAAQPITVAFDIGYKAQKYSFSVFGKYQAKHSGKFYFYDNSALSKKEDLKLREVSTKAYFVLDLLGEYQFNKNFKINAGIFNIFDKNYVMWDTIRESKNNGTLSFYAKQEDFEGSGIQRLAAPGRNFGISFEARF